MCPQDSYGVEMFYFFPLIEPESSVLLKPTESRFQLKLQPFSLRVRNMTDL